MKSGGNSNPRINSCSFRMKVSEEQTKTTEKKWRHHFIPLSVVVGIFRRSMAANSVVGGPMWPKFEPIEDIMHILVTCKLKRDRININRQKVDTSIFRHSRAANFEVNDDMYVLVPCKYEKDPTSKKRGYTVFPIIRLLGFFLTLEGS